jgi:hypothetical protein
MTTPVSVLQSPLGEMTVLHYLDPGSGSVLLQLILGGVAAVGVAMKFYWRRIRRALRIGKPDTEIRR